MVLVSRWQVGMHAHLTTVLRHTVRRQLQVLLQTSSYHREMPMYTSRTMSWRNNNLRDIPLLHMLCLPIVSSSWRARSILALLHTDKSRQVRWPRACQKMTRHSSMCHVTWVKVDAHARPCAYCCLSVVCVIVRDGR